MIVLRRFLSILFVLYLCTYICCAQARGSYYSEKGFVFTIEDSLAVLRFPEEHLPTRYTDTVAVCRITPENDSFIRIDSKSPYDTVSDCLQIEESVSKTCSPDSLYISFWFPVEYTSLRIDIVDYLTFDTVAVIEYPEKKSIVLPRSDNLIFGIEPISVSGDLSIFNLYNVFGLLPAFPISYKAKSDSTNIFIISVPCINEGFFEQIWIQGEYVKLVEDGLVWRGMVFHPQRQSGSHLHPLIYEVSTVAKKAMDNVTRIVEHNNK